MLSFVHRPSRRADRSPTRRRGSPRPPKALASWIALATLGLTACSSPERLSTDAGIASSTARAQQDAAPPRLPAGALCAPSRSTAVPALSPSDAASDDGAAQSCAPAGSDAGGLDGAVASDAGGPHAPFSAEDPIGIGYTNGDDRLSPHVAYLTFDDGPSDWTSDILDTLQSRGVHATFFVTAQQLKGAAGLDGTYVNDAGMTVVYRDMLEREAAEGHAIGNHTVNHPDLGVVTEEQAQDELDQNELLMNIAFLKAGGTPHVLTLVRPPYGSPFFGKTTSSAKTSAGDAISRHGVNVLWTLDSTDSAEWAQDESYSRTLEPVRAPNPPTYAAKAQRLKDTVLTDPGVLAGNGTVILMHDTHDTTRDVLPEIIDGLAALGYSFDVIENYVRQRWGRPSADLTPGPSLYADCVDPRDWGCAAFGVPVGTDRTHEVCGRLWLAYQAFGGFEVLGAPIALPDSLPSGGGASQAFEHGTIELHPENAPPCNVVFIPQ